MPTTPDAGFTNLEKLIGTIGSDKAVPNPGIDRRILLAELALLKRIVADSPYPAIKTPIPGMIRPSITGPEVPVPRMTGPEIPLPGGGDAGITGPEVDTDVCPVCRRPF